MDYWCETDWYAVQCKLHHEKLAVARVAKLEVEVFFPKIVQGQGVSGESRSPTKPLFPGYFFARFARLFRSTRSARPRRPSSAGNRRFPIPLMPGSFLPSGTASKMTASFTRNCTRCAPARKCRRTRSSCWLDGPSRAGVDDHRRVLILLEEINNARVLVDKGWLAVVETV